MKEAIVEVTLDNAQSLLIDESHERPVLVDFWADWCAPCKSLLPVLEKLANEYAGQFLLAKVNADDQNMLASQFGVRSLPTVMLMKAGQPVDGFTGAKPESDIREFLDQHLPKAWDTDFLKAKSLLEDGQLVEAQTLLKSAYSASNERADIAVVYADLLLQLKRVNEAEQVLSSVKMVDQDALYEQVLAKLDLAKNATKAPEVEALEAQLKQAPEDLDVLFQLGLQYSQHEYQEEALDTLFKVLKKNLNYNDGAVKKAFTDLLLAMGKGDPVAIKYQQKLYTLLY